MTAPAAARLDSVQVLRAFAALMVVFGHVLGTVERFPDRFGAILPIRYAGGAGVDVFFVISGFIMVFASRRMFGSVAGARDFVLRRLVRIVPPYWAATVAILLLLAVRPGGAVPSATAIAASFAFLPFNTLGRADGYAIPVLDLGWTLNYEMMFYAVFALFVPLGRTRGVVGVTAVMVGLVVVGQFVPPAATAPHFWTRGIILEFVAGMAVAMAYSSGKLSLPGLARWALVGFAMAWYLVDPMSMMDRSMTPNDLVRVVGWGLPATALLVAALGGPLSFRSLPGRWAMLLGDASYVLYLLHPFVLIAMMQVFRQPMLAGGATPIVFMAGTVGLSCVAAVAAHLWLERPVVTWLTHALRRGGAPIGAVPLPPETDPVR